MTTVGWDAVSLLVLLCAGWRNQHKPDWRERLAEHWTPVAAVGEGPPPRTGKYLGASARSDALAGTSYKAVITPGKAIRR